LRRAAIPVRAGMLRVLVAAALWACASVQAANLTEDRWFRPCEDLAKESKRVRQWLSTPAGTEAQSCFLLNRRYLLVLAGYEKALLSVDLEKPDAEPQELMSLNEGEMEEFTAVNGKRYVLMNWAGRGGNFKNYSTYLFFLVPLRGQGLPVRIVELTSSFFTERLDAESQREIVEHGHPPRETARFRFRSGPTSFVEVEVDDSEQLSVREMLMTGDDGKVSGLSLLTQFDDVAMSFRLKPGSPEFQPVDVKQFIARLRQRVPSARIRENVPFP
jgi:hypothetical protein